MYGTLDVKSLGVSFNQGTTDENRVLSDVCFSIKPGEVVGLVGESGSGKTVFGLSILGLLSSNARIFSGSIQWSGRELLTLSSSELRSVRGKEIVMIFQDPQSSLNPVFSVGTQLMWLLKLHRGLCGKAAKRDALAFLRLVHLSDPERCFAAFAHQLSGGMAQRVMIAMALVCKPSLLIADEPTSGLDVITQAEILRLLMSAKEETGMSVLLISHDLILVAGLADRIAVLQNGCIVECGPTVDVLCRPSHPYTQRLTKAARLDLSRTPSSRVEDRCGSGGAPPLSANS